MKLITKTIIYFVIYIVTYLLFRNPRYFGLDYNLLWILLDMCLTVAVNFLLWLILPEIPRPVRIVLQIITGAPIIKLLQEDESYEDSTIKVIKDYIYN